MRRVMLTWLLLWKDIILDIIRVVVEFLQVLMVKECKIWIARALAWNKGHGLMKF